MKKWLESDHGRLVKFHCRYVDIFCLFENEHQADFPQLFIHLTPKFKFHYSRRAETNPICGFYQYSFRQINYECLKEKYIYQDFYKITIILCHLHTRKVSKTLTDKTFCLNNAWDGFH